MNLYYIVSWNQARLKFNVRAKFSSCLLTCFFVCLYVCVLCVCMCVCLCCYSSMLCVVCDNCSMLVVDTDTRRIVRRFLGHSGRITDVVRRGDRVGVACMQCVYTVFNYI